jgi:hypothetical protein
MVGEGGKAAMSDNLALPGTLKLLEALPNHKYKICGIASHGGLTTYHKGEVFNKRHYITGELQKAVPSLLGKPIFLDHETPFKDCSVTLTKWDDKANGVYYEAEITEEVANMIRSGKITGVSLNTNPWIKGGGVKYVDGFAPFGFEFEELSLTDDRMIPGDPQATVRFLEALEKQFEIDPKHLAEAQSDKLKDPPKDPPLPEKEAEVEIVKSERELSAMEKFRKRRR